MIERVAALVAPGQEQGGARVVGEVPHVAGKRRHEEERRAVEIAGDADERGERRAARRLQRRQRAGAGESHQPLGVGHGLAMGLIVGIVGDARHCGLDPSGKSE